MDYMQHLSVSGMGLNVCSSYIFVCRLLHLHSCTFPLDTFSSFMRTLRCVAHTSLTWCSGLCTETHAGLPMKHVKM